MVDVFFMNTSPIKKFSQTQLDLNDPASKRKAREFLNQLGWTDFTEPLSKFVHDLQADDPKGVERRIEAERKLTWKTDIWSPTWDYVQYPIRRDKKRANELLGLNMPVPEKPLHANITFNARWTRLIACNYKNIYEGRIEWLSVRDPDTGERTSEPFILVDTDVTGLTFWKFQNNEWVIDEQSTKNSLAAIKAKRAKGK